MFGLHRSGGFQSARKEWVIAEIPRTTAAMTYRKPPIPSKWVMKSLIATDIPTRAWRTLWGTAQVLFPGRSENRWNVETTCRYTFSCDSRATLGNFRATPLPPIQYPCDQYEVFPLPANLL